jgi:hypothetical protein
MPKTAEKTEETQEALPSTPEPEPIPEEVREWASPEDLGGDRDWEETTLPAMQKQVRIRYLSTPEVTRLAVLPDLVGFSQMAARLQDPSEEERAKVDTSALVVEEKRYQARAAHVAIMANGNRPSMKPVPCSDCEEDHPRSLFTLKQAERLHPYDLAHVTLIAVQASSLGAVRPFSRAAPHPDSPQPVNSSE